MSQRPALIYLHGFLSSPASQKATELAGLLAAHHPDVELVVPTLSLDPDRAFDTALVAAKALGNRLCGVIGSSLGGFYAAALSHQMGCRAALVNPAVYPYRLLVDYLGPQTNPYTGDTQVLQAHHMQALEQLDPGPLERPERLLLVLQTGDETLDYHQAIDRYPGSPAWIQPGGDHRFQSFEQVVPAILAFLGVPCHPRAIGYTARKSTH